MRGNVGDQAGIILNVLELKSDHKICSILISFVSIVSALKRKKKKAKVLIKNLKLIMADLNLCNLFMNLNKIKINNYYF